MVAVGASRGSASKPLRRLLLVVAAAALATLLLAACGDTGAADQGRASPSAHSPAPAVENVAGADIAIEGYAFQPAEIQIAPGTTVTWTNRDAVAHTVSARDGRWGSGLVPQDQQFAHTFTQPGTYDYFCQPHPWMVGRIVVGQGAAVAAPSPAPAAAPDEWAQQMRRWMDQMSGLGSFDAMLQWMRAHGGSGMMASPGMMGGSGMMGGR